MLLLLIFVLQSEARVWTEKESGRQIKADVVKVYSSREVVLKKRIAKLSPYRSTFLFLLMLSTLNISLNTAIVDFFIQFIGGDECLFWNRSLARRMVMG